MVDGKQTTIQVFVNDCIISSEQESDIEDLHKDMRSQSIANNGIRLNYIPFLEVKIKTKSLTEDELVGVDEK